MRLRTLLLTLVCILVTIYFVVAGLLISAEVLKSGVRLSGGASFNWGSLGLALLFTMQLAAMGLFYALLGISIAGKKVSKLRLRSIALFLVLLGLIRFIVLAFGWSVPLEMTRETQIASSVGTLFDEALPNLNFGHSLILWFLLGEVAFHHSDSDSGLKAD